MQNIIEILKTHGVDIPEEKATDINKAVSENYKTIAEVEKKLNKIENEKNNWKERAEMAEETLKNFEGKDFDAITKERDEWKEKAEQAEKDYNQKEAVREKRELLKEAIADIEFTSIAAKNAIMAQIEEGVSVKNGKLIGFNDLLEDARKNDSAAFVNKSVEVPRITSNVVNNNNSAGGVLTKKEIDSIKDTRERQKAMAESIARGDGIYLKQ